MSENGVIFLKLLIGFAVGTAIAYWLTVLRHLIGAVPWLPHFWARSSLVWAARVGQ